MCELQAVENQPDWIMIEPATVLKFVYWQQKDSWNETWLFYITLISRNCWPCRIFSFKQFLFMMGSYAILPVVLTVWRLKKNNGCLRGDRNCLFLSVKEVLVPIVTKMKPFSGLTNCQKTQNISLLTFIILRNHMHVSKRYWRMV